MKAYILCDASYDNICQISSCAGSVVFNGEAHRFTERATNISDSSEAELFAIFASLQVLWRKICKANLDEGVKVSDIKIFTDSVTAHTQLIPEDFNKNNDDRNLKYQRYRTKIESLTRAIGAVATIKQVAAHKKAEEASPLEARHNEIDAMALEDLRAYRAEMFNPNIENSKYYGVNLNMNYNPKKENVMFKLGYEMAEAGFIARLHFEGGTIMDKGISNHPYTKGIAYYAKEQGLIISDLIEPIDWNTDCWNDSDNKHGCNGLDSVLLRDLLNQEELLKIFDFESASAKKAGACNRLMFGHQVTPKKKHDTPNKYRKGPSRFLVNFGNNKGERRWLSCFAERAGMPYLRTTGRLKTQMEQLKERGEILEPDKQEQEQEPVLMTG